MALSRPLVERLHALVAGIVGLGGLCATWWLYTPWLASVRREVFWVGLATTAAAGWIAWRRQLAGGRRAGLFALAGAFAFLLAETRFQIRRWSITSEMSVAAGADYSNVGRHIIVGYRQVDELKRLIFSHRR